MSKVLEALEKIKTGEFIECDICDANWSDGCMCCVKHLCRSQEIKAIEKELNALKIIKEKLDVGVVILGDQPTIRITYKGLLRFYDISQEEYEILKEELK